jgi:hypothetical protein
MMDGHVPASIANSSAQGTPSTPSQLRDVRVEALSPRNDPEQNLLLDAEPCRGALPGDEAFSGRAALGRGRLERVPVQAEEQRSLMGGPYVLVEQAVHRRGPVAEPVDGRGQLSRVLPEQVVECVPAGPVLGDRVRVGQLGEQRPESEQDRGGRCGPCASALAAQALQTRYRCHGGSRGVSTSLKLDLDSCDVGVAEFVKYLVCLAPSGVGGVGRAVGVVRVTDADQAVGLQIPVADLSA